MSSSSGTAYVILTLSDWIHGSITKNNTEKLWAAQR